MDDWTREREHLVTDDHDEDAEVVNGSRRGSGGRFKNLPDRVFRTDGAEPLPPDEFHEMLLKIRQQTLQPRVLSALPAMERALIIRRLCEALEYEAVAYARGLGWSWRDVGDALGMSESGAHKRFARALEARRRHPRP